MAGSNTSTIHIKLGTMLERVHEVVASTQARDVVLTLERGVVKHTEACLDGEAA
jgi:hypothetical protein